MSPRRKERPKPCPHCGATNEVAVVAEEALSVTFPVFYVFCEICGARGGRRDSREAAAAAWDERHPAGSA